MIAPGRALRDVRAGLRAEVMPELASDRARAVLGSALGILDELAGRIQLDATPARATAAELIRSLPRWERRLAAASPGSAAAVAELRAEAEGALPEEPLRARERALAAAEAATAAAWRELEGRGRGELLAEIRVLSRADLERQEGEP